MNHDLLSFLLAIPTFILGHKKRKQKKTIITDSFPSTSIFNKRRIGWIFSPFCETLMWPDGRVDVSGCSGVGVSPGRWCQPRAVIGWCVGSAWLTGSPALLLSRQEGTVPFRYHIPPKLMQHSWTTHSTVISTFSLQQSLIINLYSDDWRGF